MTIVCRAVGCECGTPFETAAALSRHLADKARARPAKPRAGRRAHKYGVSAPAARTFRGIVYASRAEMRRARELHELCAAGELTLVLPQPIFKFNDGDNVMRPDFLVIAPICNMRPDFLVIAPICNESIPASVVQWNANSVQTRNACWVEEVKGVRTPKFKHDCKLWRKHGPVPLRILTRQGHGWAEEWIIPVKGQ